MVEEVVEVDEEMDSEWKLAEIESGLPHCSFCSTKHVAEVVVVAAVADQVKLTNPHASLTLTAVVLSVVITGMVCHTIF